jgi:hypothetical protein
MIYAKLRLADGVEIKTDAEKLEFLGVCPICGSEYPIEFDEIAELPEGLLIAPFCEDCSNDINLYTVEENGAQTFGWLNMLLHSGYPSNIFTYALQHAPRTILDQAADEFSHMVPGYHDDQPIGDINDELERREKAKKQAARCLRVNEL